MDSRQKLGTKGRMCGVNINKTGTENWWRENVKMWNQKNLLTWRCYSIFHTTFSAWYFRLFDIFLILNFLVLYFYLGPEIISVRLLSINDHNCWRQ